MAKLEADEKSKVTFYLRKSVQRQIEDVEGRLRSLCPDYKKRKLINKSTIVETALLLAMSDFDEDEKSSGLTAVMVGE